MTNDLPGEEVPALVSPVARHPGLAALAVSCSAGLLSHLSHCSLSTCQGVSLASSYPVSIGRGTHLRSCYPCQVLPVVLADGKCEVSVHTHFSRRVITNRKYARQALLGGK